MPSSRSSSQSYADFELIISDNASTDSTSEICRGWAERDGRIRYFRNPSNIGAAPNYHHVFQMARADLFKWSAHDDMLDPGFLESCVAALDDDAGAVLAYTAARQVDGDGKPLGDIPRFSQVVSADPVERFREVVRRERLNLPIFGLVRSAALRETASTRLLSRQCPGPTRRTGTPRAPSPSCPPSTSSIATTRRDRCAPMTRSTPSAPGTTPADQLGRICPGGST